MEKITSNEGFKILCPYCSEVWDAEMETKFDYSMGSEETGIYDESLTVEIHCSNCKRSIYKKNA